MDSDPGTMTLNLLQNQHKAEDTSHKGPLKDIGTQRGTFELSTAMSFSERERVRMRNIICFVRKLP